MSNIKQKIIKDPQVAMNKVIELSKNRNEHVHIFRGQSEAKWKIQSTYHRYASWKIRDFFGLGIETITQLFIERAVRNGHERLKSYNIRGQLEYARHAGVPSPLVDFSYSPLVALWFAFSGVRQDERGYVALYALNTDILRNIIFDFLKKQIENNKLPPKFINFNINNAIREFPEALIFLNNSASWNVKMYRQQGCFIYDGLSYSKFNSKNLEDVLVSGELSEKGPLVMERYLIPKKHKQVILEFLRKIGIGGEYLYNDEQGILIDIINEPIRLGSLKAWDLKQR